MGFSNQRSSYSNRRDSRSGGFGGRDFAKPEMHDAVCNQCGERCKVPFRPSGDKPVYCSECFGFNKDNESDRPQRGRDNDRRGGGRDRERDRGDRDRPTTMHEAVCDECGQKCEVPFKPSSDKPIFCSECFGNKKDSKKSGGRSGGEDLSQLKEQFDRLNTKLDKVLEVLAKIGPSKVEVSKDVKKVLADKKAVLVKKDEKSPLVPLSVSPLEAQKQEGERKATKTQGSASKATMGIVASKKGKSISKKVAIKKPAVKKIVKKKVVGKKK